MNCWSPADLDRHTDRQKYKNSKEMRDGTETRSRAAVITDHEMLVYTGDANKPNQHFDSRKALWEGIGINKKRM